MNNNRPPVLGSQYVTGNKEIITVGLIVRYVLSKPNLKEQGATCNGIRMQRDCLLKFNIRRI